MPFSPTRRSALALLGALVFPSMTVAQPFNKTKITIYKDRSCGCCGNWARYMQTAGFATVVEETTDVAALKSRLGVPDDLASCHTAVIAGYAIEGHVPVSAVRRLLTEQPNAIGLAVPGMPGGAPGMGAPGIDASLEAYEVVLFGPTTRSTYMRFIGDRQV